jgi:hypothetical protein
MLDIQIPVAVIETEPDDQNGLGEIRGKLKEELGESHVLEEILSLNDLGMDVPQNFVTASPSIFSSKTRNLHQRMKVKSKLWPIFGQRS